MKKGSAFDEDGELIDVNKVQTALASVGVSLLDAQGQFRDFDDVIFELADKWDSLDKNSQRYVATIAAGNRQQSRFIALVSNGKRLREVAAAAEDSEDAGLIQYSKTLDSLESKQANLKTSFQQFYMDIFNGDFFKGFLEGLNSVLEGFNKLSKPTALLNVAGIISAIKLLASLGISAFSNAFGEVRMNYKSMIEGMRTVSEEGGRNNAQSFANGVRTQTQIQQGVPAGWQTSYNSQTGRMQWMPVSGGQGQPSQNLTFAQQHRGLLIGTQLAGGVLSTAGSIVAQKNQFLGAGLSGAGNALSIGSTASILASAIPTLAGAAGPIGLAVGALGGLISFISSIPSKVEKAQEEAQKATEKYDEANLKRAEAKQKVSTLEEGIEKLKSLQSTQYDSEEARKEWIDANNSLFESVPELSASFDAAGNAIIDLTSAENTLAAARKQSAQATIDSAKAELEKAEKDLVTYETQQAELFGNNGLLAREQRSNIAYNETVSATNFFGRFDKSLDELATALGYSSTRDLPMIIGSRDTSFLDVSELKLNAAKTLDLTNPAVLEFFRDNMTEGKKVFYENFLKLLKDEGTSAIKEEQLNNKPTDIIDGSSAKTWIEFIEQSNLLEQKIATQKATIESVTPKISQAKITSKIQDKILEGNLVGQAYEQLTGIDEVASKTLLRWANGDWSKLDDVTIKNGLEDLDSTISGLYNSLITLGEVDNYNDAVQKLTAGKTTYQQFLAQVEELGIKLPEAFSATYEEKFSKVANLTSKALTVHGFSDVANSLSQNVPQIYQSVITSYAKQLRDQVVSGRMTSAKASELMQAQDTLWSWAAQQGEKAVSIIAEADLTSRSGIKEAKEQLKKAGIDEAAIKSSGLDEMAPYAENMVTSINAFVDGITEKMDDTIKEFDTVSSQMDFSEAQKLAKKLGVSLADINFFDFNKGTYTYVGAAETLNKVLSKDFDNWQEEYSGYIDDQIALIGESNNLSTDDIKQQEKALEKTREHIERNRTFLEFEGQYDTALQSLKEQEQELSKQTESRQLIEQYSSAADTLFTSLLGKDSILLSKAEQTFKSTVGAEDVSDSTKATAYLEYLNETFSDTINAQLEYRTKKLEADLALSEKFGVQTLEGFEITDTFKSLAQSGQLTLESLKNALASAGLSAEQIEALPEIATDAFGDVKLTESDFRDILTQIPGIEQSAVDTIIQLFANTLQSASDSLLSAAKDLAKSSAEKNITQADIESALGTDVYKNLTQNERTFLEDILSGQQTKTWAQSRKSGLIAIAEKSNVQDPEQFANNILGSYAYRLQNVLSTSADIISGEFTQADVDELDEGEYKNKVQKFLKDVQDDLQGAVNSLLADTRKALEDHDISYSDAKSTASAAFKRALDYDGIVNQFGEGFSDIAKEYTTDQIEGLDSAYEKLSTSAEGISASDLVDALADIYLTFGEKVSQYYRNALQLGEDGKYRLNVGKLEENLSSISDVAGAQAYSERIIEQAKISVQAATEDYMSSVSSALEQAASGEKMSVSDAQSLLDKMGLRQTQEAIATLTSGSLESILNYLVGQMDLAVSAGTIDASIVQEKYTEIIQLILDAIRDSLSSNLDALGKGISGELTNSEFLSLAKQYGLNSRGNISSYKGITLGSQNQQALIAKMSRQVQDTFGLTGVGEFGQELWNLWQDSDNPLYKSYQDAEDAAKEAFAAAQAMGDATGEAAQEAWSYAQALQAAASAAKESADSAEFDFMGQDPFANRQQEHWTQLVDNIDTFKSSLQSFAKSGEMGVKDFYNIIDQIDRLGQAGSFLSNVGQDEWLKSGQTIQDWANKVVAASETIGKVDAKGFVDVGIDISAAASSMATGMTDGLKEVAKQQIDYLNGIEQMLLAMQSLEDIGDVKLNLGIGIDVDGDGKGETIETYRDLINLWNANQDNEEVKKELLFVLGVAWDKGNAGLTDIADRLNLFGEKFGGFDNETKFFESMFFSNGQFDPKKFLIGSDFFITMSDLGAEGIQGMLDLLASDMRKAGLEWEFKDGKAIFTDPAAAQKFFLDLFGEPTKFAKLLNQQANLEQYSKMLSEAGGKAIGNIKLQDGNATVDRQIKLTPGSLILVDDEGNELTGESLVDYINENADNRMVVEDYLNSVYGASLKSDQSYIVDVGEETVTYRIGTKIERKIADITGTGTDETISLPSGTITLTVEEGQLKVEGPNGAPLSDELRKEAEDQLTKDLGKPITISDTGNVTYTVFDSVEVSLNKIVATLQSISDLMSGDAFKLDFSNLDAEPLNAISTALSTISTSALGLSVVAASIATIASNAGIAESKLDKVAGELDAIAGKNKDINVNFTINGIDLISSALQFLLGNMSAENATVETTFSAKDENVDKTAKDVTSSVESVPSSHNTSFGGIVGNIISVAERVKKVIAEIPKSVNTSFTGTVSVKKTGGKPLAPSGAGLNVDLPYYTGNVDGKALVNGQTYGAALAGKTLVGELGPELAVYDNKYHLLGENGAEFVNLPSDAIVFNHLQTQGIIDGKVDKIRGTQLNAAYKRASMYSGNALVEGNAYAGGIGSALAAVRRAKSIWTNLLNSLSAADMLGGGGGGGGGGGKNASLKPYIADLQEWYNLSRQIVDLENRINTLVAQRNNLSKGFDQGAAYLRNLKESQALLEDQLNTQRDLYRYQQDELKRQADAINDSSNWISKFYKVGADGVLQYVEGNETNGGKGALEVLQELNDMGDNPERYTIKDQVAWIEEVTNGQFKRGFTWEEGQTEDENGKTVGNGEYTKKEWTDEEYVQEFFSALQEPIDDYDGLRDSVQETEEKLESLAEEIQKVNDEIRDNEIEVSQMIYDAIVQVKEKVIKDLKESNKLITDANKAYADSIQNAITKEKNQYSTNQNISERETLQRQLSLLRRSGGSASEIQSLEKTISEKLKDEYFQKQEDALEVIKDANTKQTELMEQQVQLLQDTLDYEKENGVLWTKVYEIMDQGNAFMLDFLSGAGADSFLEKANLEQKKMLEEWAFKIGLYSENERSTMLSNKYAEPAFETLKNNTSDTSKWKEGYKNVYDSVDAATRTGWDRDYLDTYNSYMLKNVNGQSSNEQIAAAQKEASRLAEQTFFEHIAQEKKRREDNEKAKNQTGNSGSSGGSSGSSGGGSSSTKKTSTTRYYWENSVTGESGYASSKSAAEGKVQESYNKWAKKAGGALAGSYGKNTINSKIAEDKKKVKRSRKAGGSATNTGLYMLHGTQENPEYILNANQTRGLEQLVSFTQKNPDFVNVLKAHYDSFAGNLASQNYTTSNSNSINISDGAIQISVAKLNDSYDIEDISNDIMDRMYSIAAKSSSRSVSRR